MLKIDSAQNQTFKKLLSLTSAKGLKKESLFLLSGEKLIREFLKKPSLKIVSELTTRAMKPVTKGKLVQLSAELFSQIDVLGTHFNILVLEQPWMSVLNAADLKTYAPRGIEVVMPVGDPGNLGALLRSCEAFGVPRAVLTREAAHPFLPKAVKASAGSVLRIPVLRGPSLREFPSDCIALDVEGISIDEFAWPKNGFLVVGEEGTGLGKKKFKQRIRIPTKDVESLNVVVAASIALADRVRKK
jgi:TrmH family RNA methyltransferase